MTTDLTNKLISIIESTKPTSAEDDTMEFRHGLNRIKLRFWPKDPAWSRDKASVSGDVIINGNNPEVPYSQQEKAFVSSESKKLIDAFLKRYKSERKERDAAQAKYLRERRESAAVKIFNALNGTDPTDPANPADQS